MANVDDPMKAWQDMIEQFQKAGLGSNCAGSSADDVRSHAATVGFAPGSLRDPSRIQSKADRNKQLAPMRQVLEGLQQAAKTTRAAGEALKEAGDLLIRQAAAMDQALSFTGPFLDMTAAA